MLPPERGENRMILHPDLDGCCFIRTDIPLGSSAAAMAFDSTRPTEGCPAGACSRSPCAVGQGAAASGCGIPCGAALRVPPPSLPPWADRFSIRVASHLVNTVAAAGTAWSCTAWFRRWRLDCRWLLVLVLGCLLGTPGTVSASPGLCVGPVCGDAFTRGSKHIFQLRLRLADRNGHYERITVDCRDGRISPAIGPVERGYGAAVARRACRLIG